MSKFGAKIFLMMPSIFFCFIFFFFIIKPILVSFFNGFQLSDSSAKLPLFEFDFGIDFGIVKCIRFIFLNYFVASKNCFLETLIWAEMNAKTLSIFGEGEAPERGIRREYVCMYVSVWMEYGVCIDCMGVVTLY